MVAPLIGAAAIGAASNLIGGFFDRKSNEKTNAANLAEAQRAAKQNYEWQKEFAQSGVKWKVDDAKASGVHPLYALGAQTNSFSPSYVGTTQQPNDYSDISRAGQDISRAVASGSNEYEQASQKLNLVNMGLQNELLASKIAQLNASTAKPFPGAQHVIPGQADSGVTVGQVQIEPSRPTSAVSDGTVEAGLHPDLAYIKTKNGYQPVPSSSAKQLLEDMTIPEFMWSIRNNILPTIGINQSPPPIPVPEGHDAWSYDPFTQQYVPVKKHWTGVYY